MIVWICPARTINFSVIHAMCSTIHIIFVTVDR